MVQISTEALTGIRLLVCLGKADGTLRTEEREFLEDALAGLQLPEGLSFEQLIEEKNDPAQLAQQIKGKEARDYTYASLFSLAYCDHDLAPAEASLLDTLRNTWGIEASEEEALRKALDQSKRITGPHAPVHEPVNDAQTRDAEFSRLLNRYCILTGLTGAIPIPLVPDLLIVPMQVKLVYDIAGLFGQKTDKASVQLMFETLGMGTGARVGISMLAKLIPVWGSAFGAASSFATTYALGKVAQAYYRSEGKQPVESFKPMFKAERQQGREEYQKQKPVLEEAQKTHAATLRQLAFDMQAGRITQQEYEQKVDALQ